MDNMVGNTQTVQVPNYSGVNIQIFNPSVTTPGAAAPVSTVNAGTYTTNPGYPANYYTQNLAQTQSQSQVINQAPTPEPVATAKAEVADKTEKREIVELTDDYIKNLEGYLNNQKKDVRLMGAKELLNRLEEDESRKDDVALNALINKTLQDPYQPVKFIGMVALESKLATGNELTVKLLKNIQHDKAGYGEDSLKASDILLRMSGQSTKKDFKVENQPSNKGEKE